MKEFRDNAEVKKVKSLLKQEYTLRERERENEGLGEGHTSIYCTILETFI